MKDTIDQRIHEVLTRKGELFEKVVDGLSQEKINEMLTLDDLFEILGMQKKEVDKPRYFNQNWSEFSIEEIEKQLHNISPLQFEDLAMQLFHYLGYSNVKVTKRTGDGGIDVVSTKPIGNGIERIAAQCKRYVQPIGVTIAREFVGAIEDDKSIIHGYLVTTSSFTSDCISYCLRHNIEMINGSRMAKYVKDFGLQIRGD